MRCVSLQIQVWDRDRGVAGRNGREKCFPDEGSSICPPDKSMIYEQFCPLIFDRSRSPWLVTVPLSNVYGVTVAYSAANILDSLPLYIFFPRHPYCNL